MRRVLALGTFDLLHVGHARFLRTAKRLGDHLTVAVNTDEFAERYKRKPIMGLWDRANLVSMLECVDDVILNHGDEDARPAILESKAGVVVHGDDWTGRSYLEQLGVTQEWLKKHDVVVAFVPYETGISTSEIISRCVSRQ